MATLDDIAAAVGVSRSTVSRILNGRDTMIPISAQTRERILAVAAELHYTPNLFARGLKSRRSHVIGLAVRDLTYLFWSGIIKGINDACSARGYHVILSNTTSKDQAEEAASIMLGQLGVDGLVVAGDFIGDDASIDRIRQRCPHIVAVCRSVDPNQIPVLRVDDAAGMRLVLDYLYSLRHRRFGFVGLNRPGSFLARQSHYRDFLAAHNLPVDERLIQTIEAERFFPSTEEFIAIGAELTGRILRSGQPVDAIVCVCDALALGALEAAKEAGIAVPDELSITGFDDAPFARYCSPKLTTVHQPMIEMGRGAANLLIDLIEGQAAQPSEAILFEPTLVVRESTGSPGR